MTFWNWNACRKFIEEAVRHYKNAPGWFTDWLDDLYIRLGGKECGKITLEEIQVLGMLNPDNEGWAPEQYAVNSAYKYFDRVGRDTTGILGY